MIFNRTLVVVNSSWSQALSNYTKISQIFLLSRTIDVTIFLIRKQTKKEFQFCLNVSEHLLKLKVTWSYRYCEFSSKTFELQHKILSFLQQLSNFDKAVYVTKNIFRYKTTTTIIIWKRFLSISN